MTPDSHDAVWALVVVVLQGFNRWMARQDRRRFGSKVAGAVTRAQLVHQVELMQRFLVARFQYNPRSVPDLSQLAALEQGKPDA